MSALEIGLRTLLLVVFAVACVSKLRTPAAFAAFRATLADLGPLGTRGRTALAAAVPVSEFAVVVLLAVPAEAGWGFALATALMLAFTSYALWGIAGGRRVTCQCFGASATVMGMAQVVRNLLLLAAAAAGLALTALAAGPHVAPPTVIVAGGLALFGGIAFVRWDDVVYLVRG